MKQDNTKGNEGCLSYNKYGQWVDGEWMPYDDMELA